VTRETDGAAETSTFGVASSWNALRAACSATGFNDDDARLIRLGENALFHLPKMGVVVRVARSMDYWADAEKEVNVAYWLAKHKFPGAQAYEIPQPISVNGHPVTFWKFIAGRPGDQRDIATLGVVLRRLNSIPAPTTFTLPDENILGRIEPRVEAAAIPSSDKDFLFERLSELKSALPRLHYPLSPAPIHGDAHVQNLMICDGQPVLIDFERFEWGQPEWDLALTATEYLTAKWWTRDQYDQFVGAYGYDVTTWTEGFDTLRAVHQLKMTTWLMQNVAESPEIATEYEIRVRTLRGEPSPGWRPF